MAASGAAFAQTTDIHFHVAAGTLDSALTQVAAQSGHRILFDPAVVNGRMVPGLDGTLSPEAAVRRLLDGTDLVLRADSEGQWTIVRSGAAVAPPQGEVIGTVRVTTGAEGIGYVGANGSSDPLATEGTKSYTASAQAISSKQPLSLKETPQAVSVLTRQQLDDRALNSFGSALDALPGITTTESGGSSALTSQIFSRGFAVSNLQIDGGSPVGIGTGSTFTSNHRVVDDLSAYDSVEVERGAGGQFTGIGDPGGILSLVRKRPLDHAALDMLVQGGSWNRYRGVIDASSPVWLNGLVRVRTVLTAEDNKEFYDTAKRRFWQAYVNVEIDPSPTTTINIGTKFTHDRSTPFNGLPTDQNGALVDYPRTTCFCTPWSRATVDGKEFFGELTQKLGKDWTFHLNGSADLQDIKSHYFSYVIPQGAFGGYVPTDPFTVSRNVYDAVRHSDQYLVDAFVAGKMSLWGIGIETTLGANFQKITQAVNDVDRYYYYSSTIPFLPFSPDSYLNPTGAQLAPGIITYPLNSQQQYGLYGTVKISPKSWIHVTVGERITHYTSATIVRTDLSPLPPTITPNNVKYTIVSPPNIGLVVDLTKQISAFASYANIFNRNNDITKDGKLLSPTTGLNAETGLKAALYHGRLNVSGSLFYIKQINLPQYDYSAPYVDDNPTTGASCCYVTDGSKYISKGFDGQIQGALTHRLNVDLSYVFDDFKYVPGTTNQTNQSQLTQPKHLAKLWAAWNPPIIADRVLVGAGLHVESGVTASFQTEVYTPGAGFNEVAYYTNRDGYTTVDAMVKFKLNDKLNVQLNLTNIFDKKYYQTVRTLFGNYYGTPRSFLLTLHGAF